MNDGLCDRVKNLRETRHTTHNTEHTTHTIHMVNYKHTTHTDFKQRMMSVSLTGEFAMNVLMIHHCSPMALLFLFDESKSSHFSVTSPVTSSMTGFLIFFVFKFTCRSWNTQYNTTQHNTTLIEHSTKQMIHKKEGTERWNSTNRQFIKIIRFEDFSFNCSFS